MIVIFLFGRGLRIFFEPYVLLDKWE